MSMRRLLMICVCAVALCGPPVSAWAQDKVNVRSGIHDDYGRVVFDWDVSVPYSVMPSGDDGIDISFQRAATLDISGVNPAEVPLIKAIEKLSADSENLKVRIKIPAGSKYRHFLVGNRVVIDVYGKTANKEVAEKKTAPAPVVPAPVKKADQPPVPAMPVAAVEDKKSPPAPVIAQPEASITAPHTITVSSTTAMGLAVFQRNGDLWVVIDRPDVSIPPQITGPEKALFKPFKRADIQGGVAFYTPLPEGANVYGEGGGLVWKLIVTPELREVTPIAAERSFQQGQAIRGGTMSWPMQRVTKVLTLTDPAVGDKILVGTVDRASQFSGSARDFIDFSTLPTPVGLAVVPKADDLELTPTGAGIQITRPGGLALSRTREIAQKIISQESDAVAAAAEKPAQEQNAVPDNKMKRIFDFDRWMMGGLQALRENQQILLAGMANKDKTGKVQDLLMMAKMNMANDRGQEAVGLLNFAENEMPDIADSPEFLALRGAAEALAGKFEVAFDDLSTPVLKDYNELDYWRAYALAGLEDWQQAKAAMPDDFDVLLNYPLSIQERVALKLAEVALRSGDTKTADLLLSGLEKDRSILKPWTVAGVDYLKGEMHRQAGEITQATELWKPLSTGKDDLYRTKANLAMTAVELQNKKITPEQAIDRLEGLRYHWRGDELEAQINYMLGKLYFDQKRYLKGFTILRDAAAMSPDADIAREIDSYMKDAFKNLFLSKQLDELTPVDAVTVYEEFRDLTPPGDEGNRLVQRLAERLVDADLLGRAAGLLQQQVDYRLTGREAADVGVRLAGIYLLNDDPKPAIAALDKASAGYAALDQNAGIAAKQKEIQLLRARALSHEDRVEDALALLNTMSASPEVNRLRADIAWNAGMWQDAAEALQDLILDEAIDVARPLTQKQADLILNRSVALNLAGDRVSLANMRTRYGEAMDKTSRAKMFDVVTRSRTGALSSDRDSIAALVSEVDLFKEFLDSYRADSTNPSN
jgi:hypothetical protein